MNILKKIIGVVLGTGIKDKPKTNFSDLDIETDAFLEFDNQYFYKSQRADEILNDCNYLISTTSNPDTFFSRYEFFENKFHRTYSNLSKMLYDKKNENTKSFIVRYFLDVSKKAEMLKTQKGRTNRIEKSMIILQDYFEQMSADNVEFAELTYNRLMAIEDQ